MSTVRVTPEQIEEILNTATITDMKIGTKTTLVHVVPTSGFDIIETSSCVDPENYDHDLGKKICLERIKNKLWMLEGYKLQCSLK